jgi:maltokinase
MNRRLDDALVVVPELAPHADRLRRAFDAVSRVAGVRVQRIHGDLHLGQTLRTVRGWKIVDFEGEPAKPLADRALPDSPWRDVAGMLRSFDYAPRVVERTWGEDYDDATEQRSYRAAEWAERNREAFLTADKAVYETVYETRNRPTWVGIPLEAVARIGVS